MIAKRPSRAVPFSEFEQNRQKYTIDELRKYQGKWVAFSADGSRVLASDEDLIEVNRSLIAAGHDPQQAPLEFIDLDDSIDLGGVTLL